MKDSFSSLLPAAQHTLRRTVSFKNRGCKHSLSTIVNCWHAPSQPGIHIFTGIYNPCKKKATFGHAPSQPGTCIFTGIYNPCKKKVRYGHAPSQPGTCIFTGNPCKKKVKYGHALSEPGTHIYLQAFPSPVKRK